MLTFGHKTPDPEFIILERRVKKVRALYHRSEYHQQICDALYLHTCRGTTGTPESDEPPTLIPPGVCSATTWPTHDPREDETHGPIGLLLAAIARAGTRLDGDWVLWADLSLIHI
eukprot:12323306-Alexandrium_andersonii.AAC.1